MSLSKRLINTGSAVEPAAPGYYGVRYSGTGSTQDITGFGFQPDIVWVKGNIVTEPAMTNSATGPNSFLRWNTTAGLTSNSSSAIPIADGVRITGNTETYNQIGVDYDLFAWKAGGPLVINNTGTIQSQVSANVANGVSLVIWSGNLTNGATIAHGLNSAPELVIVKSFTGDSNWLMGGAAMGNNAYMLFNSYGETINTGNTTRFQTFNDTTFSVGTSDDINSNSKSYIAWCFHSVEGFSKIGNVNTGNVNGSVTGLSFAPKFFLGRSINCGFPNYMKNNYMGDYFYQLHTLTDSTRGPGLRLNADSFDYYLYFNNHLRCNNLLYATFGSDLM